MISFQEHMIQLNLNDMHCEYPNQPSVDDEMVQRKKVSIQERLVKSKIFSKNA